MLPKDDQASGGSHVHIKWKHVDFTGPEPGPRCFHTTVVLGAGAARFVVVWGGHRERGVHLPDALHTLDLRRT